VDSGDTAPFSDATDYNAHMFLCYADETGHFRDPHKHFVGIAGFLASADKWMHFEAEWRAICNEEGIEMPFHMTEFAHHKKQFNQDKWRVENNRKKALGRLIEAILHTEALPIGAVASIEDFNLLSESQRERLGGDPYFVVFQEYTHQMAVANALVKFPPHPVSMVYAKLNKYVGKAAELWNAIRKNNPMYGQFMNSFIADEPQTYIPLQAADIWAYELGHHFEHTLPLNKAWRWPFEAIVNQARQQSYRGHGKFFSLCDQQFMLRVLGEAEP
jgi:hypothetical protein